MFTLNAQVSLTLVQTMYQDAITLDHASQTVALAFGREFGGATITAQSGVWAMNDGTTIVEQGYRITSFCSDVESASAFAITTAHDLNASLTEGFKQEAILVTTTAPNGATVAAFVE